MNKTLLVSIQLDRTARTMPVAAGYRPHFALPKSQHLMGIEFVRMVDEFAFDVPLTVEVKLIYDGVDYSSLAVGIHFDIREGSHIVGHGKVLPSY